MKEVTAAIIIKDDKVLIAQRGQGEKLAGKWEFPGGKLESGETEEECLRREIKEEFDVEVEVLDKFGESIYECENGVIKLIAFWCRWTSGDFILKVHSNIEWVNKNLLGEYDFAPADIPLVEKLKSAMN